MMDIRNRVFVRGLPMEKKYDLQQVSEITDLSPSTIRKRIRKKKLAAEKVDGKWLVTESALRKSGLSPRLSTITEKREEKKDELALLRTSPGYLLLEKLSKEKETTFDKWKAHIQSMHKEIVSVKDEQVSNLTEENRALKNELREITKRLPKLFELEKLEQAAQDQKKKLSLMEKNLEELKAHSEEERNKLTEELASSRARAEATRKILESYRSLSWFARIFNKPDENILS